MNFDQHKTATKIKHEMETMKHHEVLNNGSQDSLLCFFSLVTGSCIGKGWEFTEVERLHTKHKIQDCLFWILRKHVTTGNFVNCASYIRNWVT